MCKGNISYHSVSQGLQDKVYFEKRCRYAETGTGETRGRNKTKRDATTAAKRRL